MEVVIREPTVADADALGRMHWASWREAYSALLPEAYWTAEGEADRIDRWRVILEGADGTVPTRIAVRDGAVLGWAAAGAGRAVHDVPPARDRELWGIYVLASEYGSGLADRLLTAVLPTGIPAQVWVFEENPRARAFYGRHGFAADGARQLYGGDFGDHAEIRMVR